MELNIFMRELQSALVQRGIPDEMAAKQVANFRRSFTADDLSEIEAIQSNDEIEQLADSISAVIIRKMKAARAAQQAQIAPSKENVPEEPPKPVQEPKPKPAPKPDVKDLFDDDADEYFEYSPESATTTKGMIIFWVGLFLTLPITLGLLAGIFLVFAALFIGLAALIVAGCVLLAGVVAAGAVVSLVGIIFGITQLFSFVAAGIYEIGLGIMVAGAVLFVAVLIYNISVRLLPWIISQVGTFMGFVYGKLKDLFFVIRRECYKL
ncbi:MAG: hypothetical protein IJ037_12940 [Clostridia bacterium]|nr:hypothetical protein [Clostridia bacterium]MBQ8370411.1 hypothetical protein [Clostridia bacterium]MBQ8512007.1 hypothetical protein [Clostridia bacterium]